MLAVLFNCWALFFGMGLIMLGNGLQNTLLGVRATMEGFGTSVTGLVMSGYFLGLVTGCKIIPRVIGRVGHIRSFGALASLTSTSILVQVVFVSPMLWWLMRFITGFAFAGLFIVSESWINQAATNTTRGKLLSIYMLISFGGLAGGQLLLNVSSPSSFELFVLVSLLISLAVVPILVSVTRAPLYDTQESVSIVQLYRVSPLGVCGMFVSGLTYGAFYGVGAVYAAEIGLSIKNISLFMGTLVLGGFLFQYPLGWLSDTFGPIKVILLTCISGASVSFVAMYYPPQGYMLYIVAVAVGGFAMPLYSLCSVHTNNYLTPTQMVAASGTLVLLNAFGATVGAPLTAFAMDIFGSSAFYGSLGAMLCVVVGIALWRSTQRADIELEEQGEFVVMAANPMTASLTPDVELADIVAAVEKDADDIAESFEELVGELESVEEEEKSNKAVGEEDVEDVAATANEQGNEAENVEEEEKSKKR